MNVSEVVSRRAFVKTAAASGAALAAGVSGCASPGRRSQGAIVAPLKDKLRVAFIGTGGIGGRHLKETEDLGIVCPCFCDVDIERMGKAAEMFPMATRYQDYRKMFDSEHKNIDAVMFGIPDHHHYPATIIAMQHGIHVYTQKPLTHTPWEARELMLAARKYGVATQMGNQGHALNGWRLVYEWIHSGALGRILETHTWTDRPIWPQGVGRPKGEDAVPSNLDWDVWVGPAPMRPFKDADPAYNKDGKKRAGAYHWFNWRGWWDFGAGALGDMACHTMDGVFSALDPGHPLSVEPVAMTNANDETFPKVAAIKWEFAGKRGRPAFNAFWYDGGLKPNIPPDLEMERKLPQTGNLFIGTKASLLVAGDYGGSPRIIPESKMQEIGKPPKLLERSDGHVKEWIAACKGEQPIGFPKSNFEYAGPMTETILLGNIALRMGRRLEWDGEKLEFTNVAEANQYVSKEYRAGWKF